MCGIGNLQACDFMYAYEMNGSRVPGGALLEPGLQRTRIVTGVGQRVAAAVA
jgi:hypothetical protein